MGVFGAAASIYLLTMSRSVGFIDLGELAAVATTLGIAHPTGYPTITMLGHLVTRLWPWRPLMALNVLAALLVAAGAGVLVVWLDGVIAGVGTPATHPPAKSQRGSTTAPRTLDRTARAAFAGARRSRSRSRRRGGSRRTASRSTRSRRCCCRSP
jgi:hypothetical protein